jgi:hypothetical protein
LHRDDITKIVVSCANGKSNLFYELATSGNYALHTMHWLHEPSCDERWYNDICKNRPFHWVEQYINIDYNFKTKPDNADKKLLEELSTTKTEKKPRQQNPKRQREIPLPVRKPHRNPAYPCKVSDYRKALEKYVKVSTHNDKRVSAGVVERMRQFKERLSKKEIRLFVSFEAALELLQPAKQTDQIEIGVIQQEISQIKQTLRLIENPPLQPANLLNFTPIVKFFKSCFST